ncbi:hypothetical protein FKM82_003802 [Ascaphus truei]
MTLSCEVRAGKGNAHLVTSSRAGRRSSAGGHFRMNNLLNSATNLGPKKKGRGGGTVSFQHVDSVSVLPSSTPRIPEVLKLV